MALSVPPHITLYFSRHGQTQANVEKRFSGKKDTPLTETGRAQAAAIGQIMLEQLGPKPTLQFVSSPLQRAQTTMKAVLDALTLPDDSYTIDDRLSEIDLGLWDELTDEEAKALDPAKFMERGNDKWNVRVPGGENYEDVARRVSDFVHGLTHDTFAVSHGAATRILRGLFDDITWKQMSNLDEPQGVVFRVRGNTVKRLEP